MTTTHADVPGSPLRVRQICDEKHRLHMKMVGQDEWRADQLARADAALAADTERLEADLEVFRKTGRMPSATTKRTRTRAPRKQPGAASS